MRSIVCDTGPLLHLREAGCLELLQAAGRVVIPLAVESELVDSFWHKDRPAWLEIETLEPSAAEQAARWFQAGLLDPGEAAALALTMQLRAGWFLTDDAAARLIAKELGVEVHGSLGVVLWAAASGKIQQSEAESAVEALSRSSLWVSSQILLEARAALRQIYV